MLALILAAIGIGSYLFHTHARVWAMLADVVPIQAFILVYLALATIRFFGTPWWGGVLAAVAFVPASALLSSRDRRRHRPAQRLGRLPAGADPDRALRLPPPRARPRRGARPRGRRRHPRGVAVLPHRRRRGLRRGPGRHALPLAHPERRHARLDDPGARAQRPDPALRGETARGKAAADRPSLRSLPPDVDRQGNRAPRGAPRADRGGRGRARAAGGGAVRDPRLHGAAATRSTSTASSR